MIDLTVKTLDSQNHTFSVDDDITVKQFKEHIAETVNIPDTLQRLIYCGRVLQDEKLLNEYDVNGKVIHLVQRAPPSLSQRSSNSNQNQTQNTIPGGEWPPMPRIHYRQAQFHGNPMYVSSVSFPADVLEGYELPIPQLNTSLTNRHVSVIRRMLEQANRIIDRLDNPSSSTDSESASSTSQTPSQAQQEPAAESSSSESAATESKPPTPTPSASTSTPSASTESSSTSGAQPDALIPRDLAELLDKLLTTQDRLRPYIRGRLLQSPTSEATSSEENQRVLDGVTECFHFLSHAEHALSNLNVNMQQPAPRTLRCRPITIPPSAILQAGGLPIQLEAHINLHGQDPNSDSDAASTTSTTNVTASTTNSSSNSTLRAEPTTTSDTSTPPSSAERPVEINPAAAVAAAAADSLSSMFNFSNNVEVVMEMGPQAPRVWTFSTGDQNQNSSSNNNNNNNNNNNTSTANNNNNNNSSSNMTNGSTTTGTSGNAGAFPGAFPPPLPDIIRNVMQAVAGYMTQTNVTSSSIPVTQSVPTSTPGTGTPPGCLRHRGVAVTVGETTPSGQSSQTRGSTETHPTTSTQTRTTPRTHVIQHAQALGLGVGLASSSSVDFDPFLPCNSHHIRRGQASTTSTAASTQTGQGVADGSQPSQSSAGSSARTRLTTLAGVLDPDNIFNNTPLTDSLNNAAIMSSDDRPLSFNSVLLGRGINIMPDNVLSTVRRSQVLFYIIYGVLGKIPMHSWINIVNGDTSSLRSVIQELQEKLRAHYQSREESEIPDAVIEDVFPEINNILDEVFSMTRVSIVCLRHRVVDLRRTVESLIRKRVKSIIEAIFSNADDTVETVLRLLNEFCSDLGGVLRYTLPRDIDLLKMKTRFSRKITHNFPRLLREFIFQTIDNLFTKYIRTAALPSQSDITPMLVYRLEFNPTAATSSALNETQSSSEPMDIDVSSNEQSSDTLLDNEEVPSTFPGHTNLLPDWVPIIARDGVRQRRQLALGLSDNNVTTLSDAYLATMPSKRRKIVEQQKPSLLVSPSSNSNSVVTASMERLVRESIGRAGSEEVDGAISALIAEPTVRRAFGEAIRESLNPRRYETPDFPDPLRFPNATKFFTDPNIPPQ